MKNFLKKVKTLFLSGLMVVSSGAAFLGTATPVSAANYASQAASMSDNGVNYIGTPYDSTGSGSAYWPSKADCSTLVGNLAYTAGLRDNVYVGLTYNDQWTSWLNDRVSEGSATVESFSSQAAAAGSQCEKGDIVIFYKGSTAKHIGIMRTTNVFLSALMGSNPDGVVGTRYTTFSGIGSADGYKAYQFSAGGSKDFDNIKIWHWVRNKTVTVNIEKYSANTSITDGNDCYSLEGAEFDVYNGSTKIGTIGSTDGNGKASANFTVDPSTASLTIKETKASKGYYVNTQPFTATFSGSGDATSTVRVPEKPKNDPVGIVMTKVNEELEQVDTVQSMEGTTFEVNFWKGNKATSEAPDNTWVLKAVSVNGKYIVNAVYEPCYVSGLDTVYREDGKIILPAGTITIEEKGAAEGYELSGNYFDQNGNVITDINKKITLKTVDGGGDKNLTLVAGNQPGNILTQKENPSASGTITVSKYDYETQSANPQGDATNLKTTLELVNNSNYTIYAYMNLKDDPQESDWSDESVYERVAINAGESHSFNTDSKGNATIKEVEYGSYTIKEVTPPTGYTAEGKTSSSFVINDETKDTKIVLTNTDYNADDSGIFNKPIRGGFEIRKYDKDYAKYPQGDTNLSAAFKVVNKSANSVVVNGTEYAAGETVFTFRTDEEGLYTSAADLLPYGTYEIVETDPPVGYTNDGTTSCTFEIRENSKIVDLTNESNAFAGIGGDAINNRVAYGSFKIFKGMADNTSSFDSPEADVEFTAILSSKIGEGKAFANYKEAYEAIKAAGKSGDIKDADGNILLTEHEYIVVVTGKDGWAEANELAYGTYTIRQTSHHTEYEDIDWNDIHNEATFVVDHDWAEDEEPTPFYATNTPNPYYINITKKDLKTDKTVSLTSAEFKIKMLKDADGNDVSELTKDFTVSGTSQKLHIENGYVTMKVGVQNYNTFRTSSENNGLIVAATKKMAGIWSDTTNDDGSVMTPLQVVGGTYQIEEVLTPDGYLELEEPITITVVESSISRVDNDGDYIYDVEVKNDRPLGELSVEKSIEEWENDQTLIDYSSVYENIEFTLFAAEDIIDPADGSVLCKKDGVAVDVYGNEIGKFKLNSDGTYDLEGIPMGKYYLKETSVPEGIVLDETEHSVVFTQEDQLFEHKTYKMEISDNAKETGWVGTTKVVATEPGIVNTVTKTTISKTDITGEGELKGATLTIKDSKGNVVNDASGKPLTWVSGDDEYQIEGLHIGETYTLVEEITADGYVKASDIDFAVNEDGTVTSVHMIDKMVTVSKVDMGGNEVEGAEMSVTDTDGNVIDSWTSDGTEHKVNGLEENKTYVLHEVVAPEGYAKATDIEFTVTGADADGVKVDQHIDMTDKRVISKKVDMCGDYVEGAEITIYELDSDNDGNIVTDDNGDKKVIDTWTTSSEEHYVNNLEVGKTYLAVETVTPEGYAKMADYKFTVLDDGKDQTETFVDKQVEISKEDAGGKEVEGAKLTLTDKETGEIVDEWTSTKEVHYAKNIEVGKTYILTEDTTPLGYIKATEIEFTVTDNGIDQKVTMIDDVQKVNKVDEDGNQLNGATFTVVDSEGNEVDTWVSGQHIVDITEEQKSALESGETVEFTTEDGKTIKVVPVEVVDTDSSEDGSSNKISGVEDLTDEACKVEDPSGEATKQLEAEVIDDEYTVDETEASMDDEAVKADESEKIDDEYTVKQYTYTVVVTDAEGNMSYADVDTEGNETSHRISGLVFGKSYTIKETSSPDGYFYVEDTEFTADGTNTITLVDHDIVYEINKVDDKTGEYVKGVQLTLTDITDSENFVEVELPNGGITTGEAMKLDKKLIADHTYVLMETELVGGVYRSTNITFTVPHNAVEGEQVITVTMVDETVNTAVVKVDNHGNYVEGAKMQLIEVSSDLENAAADEAVADKSEEAIDEEFSVDDEEFAPGDVDTSEAVALDDDVEVADDASSEAEEATKADASEAIDEDYTVNEGTVVYEWTTGKEPEDVSNYIKGGYTYILREVEAPFGFKVMEDMTFTASGTKDAQQVIMAVDQRQTYYVAGVKVDADNTSKYLEGAELTLYTADGEIAKDVNGKDCVGVTKVDGVTTFEVEYNDDMFANAVAGYYMKETKSPKHYKLNKDKHYVELSSDYDFAVNNPVKIIVKDKYDNYNKGTAAGIGIGLGAVAAVSGIGIVATRKKKKDDEVAE